MRTFIIRARKGTTRWDQVRSTLGSREHFEVIAHAVINAFFVSNNFRRDVQVFIVLDSSEDFPRTLKLDGKAGLSLAGFHEEAVLSLIETALKDSHGLIKDEVRELAPGLSIYGFGFEKLLKQMLGTHEVYVLDPKGQDIRTSPMSENPVFILSDHLALPKKHIKSLIKRDELKTLSLGKRMLFAAQCVVILNYELDRLNL